MNTSCIESEAVVCPDFNGLNMCALIDGYVQINQNTQRVEEAISTSTEPWHRRVASGRI